MVDPLLVLVAPLLVHWRETWEKDAWKRQDVEIIDDAIFDIRTCGGSMGSEILSAIKLIAINCN